MLADRVRTFAYAEALRRTVAPDAVVLDIGTGTGVWALLACRLGARRVYAVEAGPIIHLAEQLAAANVCADRITFIRALSTEITLPEPADIVVSDIHGVLPFLGGGLEALIDARRHLRHGAAMIPREDTTWAAVVEAETVYTDYVGGWSDICGADLSTGRMMALNSTRKVRVERAALLTPPHAWHAIDYRTLASPHASAEFTTTIERPGTAHGLALWFDSVLADGIALSNAPGGDALIYGQLFFPWQEPIAVSRGDRVTVGLRAALVGREYIWTWTCSVLDGENGIKAAFHQSTFNSQLLSHERLERESPAAIPGRAGVAATAFIVDAVDGRATVAEIAGRLRSAFPNRFATDRSAIAFIRDVLYPG